MSREKKEKKDKIKTSLEIDRKEWAFVKSEAILKRKTASEIVEEALKKKRECEKENK